MAERIPQSVAIRVPLQAYLASDHVSPATGKTIAITISKNGAAYGNPSAGATNATAIASGSYYVDLSTTDTGTLGPLFIRGAEGTIDDVITIYNVVNANNAGLAGVPNAAADAAGGLPISDAGGLDLDAKLANTNEVTTARMGALTDWINGGRLDLILDIIAADTTTDIPATLSTLATAANLATVAGYIDTEIGTLQTSVNDLPTNAELATALGTADDAVISAIAALNNFDPATEEVIANVKKVNDVTVTGDGQPGTEWGP